MLLNNTNDDELLFTNNTIVRLLFQKLLFL
jgi:hypothetical protein